VALIAMHDDAPLRWYFDVISPFAYLQWPKVKVLAARRDVVLVPVLLAAVLAARGQKGPAEIPGRRELTYRHVLWQAREAGVPMQFPPAHPFNPVAALRLCIAGGCTVAVVDAVFDWIWAQGKAADSVEALQPLLHGMGIAAGALSDPAVKTALRADTDAALAAGVFGVPTLQVGDALFWGNDAHAFALAVLDDPALLDDPRMQRVSRLPVAASRTT